MGKRTSTLKGTRNNSGSITAQGKSLSALTTTVRHCHWLSQDVQVASMAQATNLTILICTTGHLVEERGQGASTLMSWYFIPESFGAKWYYTSWLLLLWYIYTNDIYEVSTQDLWKVQEATPYENRTLTSTSICWRTGINSTRQRQPGQETRDETMSQDGHGVWKRPRFASPSTSVVVTIWWSQCLGLCHYLP